MSLFPIFGIEKLKQPLYALFKEFYAKSCQLLSPDKDKGF